MSTLRRPDAAFIRHVTPRPPGHLRRARAFFVLFLLALASPLQAQAGDVQRAIEQLERCDKKERKSGCINILKRQPAGDGRLAVKAQVRGGRIIWYEYNKKTGAVRRTN